MSAAAPHVIHRRAALAATGVGGAIGRNSFVMTEHHRSFRSTDERGFEKMNWLRVALVAAMFAAACGSHRTPPRVPGSDRPPRAASDAGVLVAETAVKLEGAPYKNGGSGPSGFDCSGLVQYVFTRHGVTLPRAVRDQFQAGLAVPRSSLVPGDLVFFSTTSPGATHVGIMVKDDWFVHAPSERGVVRAERLSAPYWTRRYVGARRILIPIP